MEYPVKQLKKREIAVSVPASKSILNRALLLAAFTEGTTRLTGAARYGQDTRDLLGCLSALGIAVERSGDALIVRGTRNFSEKAALDVGSAGTAARFLPAILAYLGGNYTFTASEQMKARPMGILSVLADAGARIDFAEEEGRFPFTLRSQGIAADSLAVDTDVSTQYASGLLLAAAVGDRPFTLRLTGSRQDGSYIRTTIGAIEAFGGKVSRRDGEITVSPSSGVREYAVAPDLSGGCYFYALSLFGCRVRVNGVRFSCGQADERFFEVLRSCGVALSETADGVVADGSSVSSFAGFDVDMRDFSDQTLTLAALAPFAASPSRLRNIAHIRKQECDRVEAILYNLRALGVPCRATQDDLFISPARLRSETEPIRIRTFGDHRVAMAFSLIGLRTGNILLDDPACVSKTFDDYFTQLDLLTE